ISAVVLDIKGLQANFGLFDEMGTQPHIGIKPEYLAMLYRTTGDLDGLKLPKRNRHGKVKMSEVLLFKKEFENKNEGG
ncbi:hypothetical protein, partial [Providencia huaxiensis]